MLTVLGPAPMMIASPEGAILKIEGRKRVDESDTYWIDRGENTYRLICNLQLALDGLKTIIRLVRQETRKGESSG